MKKALLIVDHGSKKNEANDLLPSVVGLLRQSPCFEIVFHAHMELSEPTIQQGFDACVSAGAQEVIVHPYFLSHGRHSTEDIPRLVSEAASKHPGISFRLTEPLGLHPKIIEVILQRANESFGGLPSS